LVFEPDAKLLPTNVEHRLTENDELAWPLVASLSALWGIFFTAEKN
jgi:hypothetical protein